MKVYLSQSHDPFINLATEDWLYHEALADEPMLFCWRNDKSIVIGRAQNPWVECNLGAMEEDHVHLVRRQSGGGTVYHDLGNTNFTFLSPVEHYDKQVNLGIVVSALAKLGITAAINERNDILVDGFKVSGSAFRQSKDRSFHHGTLLINADINALWRYLNPKPMTMEAKGVKSVRSKVMNLTDKVADLNHDEVCQAIATAFSEVYAQPIDLTQPPMNEMIQVKVEELQDWQWRYGKTLKFTRVFEQTFTWGKSKISIDCNHGIIRNMHIEGNLDDDIKSSIVESCCGIHYAPVTIEHALSTQNKSAELLEFTSWLIKEVQ